MNAYLPLLFFWFVEAFCLTSPEDSFKVSRNVHQSSRMPENINLFSPKMDYEDWTPLGRGDPLKNDPTYDYVPPVLDRVHYWMDPSKRTPDPPLTNTGVLVLGSRTSESTSAIRQSTPRYHQVHKEADSRLDAASFLDPFFRFVDKAPFFGNQVKPNSVPRPPHHHHHGNAAVKPQPPQALQRPPYTMLMPPPPPPPPQIPRATPKTASTMALTASTTATSPTQTRPPTTSMTNSTTNDPSIFANTENVFKPVAISMPGQVEESENRTDVEAAVVSTTSLPDGDDRVLLLATETYTKATRAADGQDQQHTTTTTDDGDRRTTTNVSATNKQPVQVVLLPKNAYSKPNQVTQDYKPWSGGSVSTLRATTAPAITKTTDPMFKYYKQTLEPTRGPFFLIIQGHSKVKTYGASKNPVNRLSTNNEIQYDDDEEKKRKQHEGKARTLRHVEPEDPSWSVKTDLKDLFSRNSKKHFRRKRSLDQNRRERLLEDGREVEDDDNLDLESLIATSDDYDPEEVANILLKQDNSEGSGFSGFAASLFGGNL